MSKCHAWKLQVQNMVDFHIALIAHLAYKNPAMNIENLANLQHN